MHRNMLQSAVAAALLAGLLSACGGGGSGSMGPPSGSNSVPVPLALSDASSGDWSLIGVKVLRIALVPQGGGSNVTVWSAPNPAPYVNLEQLDDLAEIIGNASVPAGTYTGAVLTVAANPGDVLLTVAENPQDGFPVAAGTSIAASQIQIPGAQGSSGNRTVTVDVAFATPLAVSSSAVGALNLEFDLADPAFIVGHTPPAAMGSTLWAVNFHGPVRHRPVRDLAALILRHTYGTVTAVAADGSSLTLSKDFPVLPLSSPETAVGSALMLQVQADGTNGTLYYDVDAQTRTVVHDFSAEATTLTGKYVRVAARYQQDGSLVAVRVWASSDFSKVWLSPEGHVAHVDAGNNIIYITNESGRSTPVLVDANTQFFFRTPANAQADVTPIATGTAFLANQELVRGFKVHVSAVDPLATPLVAQTVDIENATYGGRISGVDDTGFTYTRNFARVSDSYAVNLSYISASTPNGLDAGDNPITGFKWWDFTYPTLVTSGTGAVPAFVAATNGGVNFGGTVGALPAWGVSAATWADAANPGGWSLRNAILMPTPVPLGTVSSGFSGTTFAMGVLGGALPVVVDVSTVSQSATLVYEIDRTNGVITISPIDVTSSSGLAAITKNLVAGVPVKVFGIPQPDGSLRAYVLIYFTGMPPSA